MTYSTDWPSRGPMSSDADVWEEVVEATGVRPSRALFAYVEGQCRRYGAQRWTLAALMPTRLDLRGVCQAESVVEVGSGEV